MTIPRSVRVTIPRVTLPRPSVPPVRPCGAAAASYLPGALHDGVVAVVDAADGTLSEHHLVLRQRARLVGEQVLHLVVREAALSDIQSVFVCLLIGGLGRIDSDGHFAPITQTVST